MNVVSNSIAHETFRAIPLVFALILVGCGAQTLTGVLPSPMQASGLPVAFAAGTEGFVPNAPVAFENGFDGAGQPMVTVNLADKDRAVFTAFTARHIGAPIKVMVCDVALVAPVIQGAVTGQTIVISGYDAWGEMADFMANGCP